MNVFTFVVGMFKDRGDRRGLREAVREAAVKDAQDAVAAYADAFESETRRLLAERQQQALSLTADPVEDADFTVVEVENAKAWIEKKPRPKRRAR